MVGAHPVAPYPAQHRHSPPDTPPPPIITAKPGDSGMLVSPEHRWQEMVVVGGTEQGPPQLTCACIYATCKIISPRGWWRAAGAVSIGACPVHAAKGGRGGVV